MSTKCEPNFITTKTNSLEPTYLLGFLLGFGIGFEYIIFIKILGAHRTVE